MHHFRTIPSRPRARPPYPHRRCIEKRTMLVLFNKPFNVLCQFTDRSATPRRTLAEFGLPSNVYPAGRLDFDSEGFLLLTDDGALAHRITDPRHKQPKTYLVQVEGTPTVAALQRLCDGIDLKDGITLPAEARPLERAPEWLGPRDPPVRFRKSVPDACACITADFAHFPRAALTPICVVRPTRWSRARSRNAPSKRMRGAPPKFACRAEFTPPTPARPIWNWWPRSNRRCRTCMCTPSRRSKCCMAQPRSVFRCATTCVDSAPRVLALCQARPQRYSTVKCARASARTR